MIKRVGERHSKGFTIVELLIVVVVIAILAAITIVSYNGIQARATDSAVKSEISQNAKTILNAANVSGVAVTTANVMSAGSVKLNYSADNYKVVTYCTNGTEFVLAAQSKAGSNYYSRSTNAAAVNDNTIDPFYPCQSLSMTGTITTTYASLPSQCSLENSVCSFSGTGTVVFGNAAQGKFRRMLDVNGSVTCSVAVFGGDPAPSIVKACYVFPN